MKKEDIIKAINDEIEFSKTCGMPQFTMGLFRAKEIIQNLKEKE